MAILRTFVAIDIPIENHLLNKWQEIKELLKSEQLKWVDGKVLHLTLFFLGDTEENNIDGIAAKIEKEVKSLKEFFITINGFGVFGSSTNPKVLWVGISNSEELLVLQNKVVQALTSYGFVEENREFKPHITLARIKNIKQPSLLTKFMQQNRSIELQETLVRSIILYKSDLKPSGPVYTPLKTIKLLSL